MNPNELHIPITRPREEVIAEIRALVSSKGYIYALCMILIEDFHVLPEELHKVDYLARLNHNEAALLLGFLIQNSLDFTPPATPGDLIQLKKRTYELMKELHSTFNTRFLEKLRDNLGKTHRPEDRHKEEKDFFGKGDMLIEPIFYSGTGAYDFQYLEFLDRKYKYDKDWLIKNKGYDTDIIKKIVPKIKDLLNQKAQKVRFIGIKEKLPEIIEKIQKSSPREEWEKRTEAILPAIELYQYVNLFSENIQTDKATAFSDIRKELWDSFYRGLIELFTINLNDLETIPSASTFFANFSITPQQGANPSFNNIGDYNQIVSHPILKVEEGKFLVPITFLLYEACYESPFYWMNADKKYLDAASKHRGQVGEEICHELLLKVFGAGRTFRSVKIKTKQGADATDIDVLCLLGSKALCVQIKSKRLTHLARKGNDEELGKDFKGAVQDAYEQGLLSRKLILAQDAVFVDEHGSEIKLSEEIDDVYIMVVTAEEYPSLAHQSRVLLERENSAPLPIAINIFDLELLVYYLTDPFDFLYYIRQRIALMDYFIANEESAFLGYHLKKKLWRTPSANMEAIDDTFVTMIERNYYPVKAGLSVSDNGDALKQRVERRSFDQLCSRLKELNAAKITDIIFYLLDLSSDASIALAEHIQSTKQKTLNDGKRHDFSMPPDEHYTPRIGFTYMSLDSDSYAKLQQILIPFCQLQKYRSKGDIWIGLGSIKSSSGIIDAVTLGDTPWEYDSVLEQESARILGQGQYRGLGKKVGRNEKCPCGSGLKYKKCCGK